jgi:HlyD family secretion protein
VIAIRIASPWLLALVACGRLEAAVVEQVPTVVVEPRQSFVRKVRADGVLRPVEATQVAAPADADGPLKIAWIVDDGAHVKKGDVVVRFDASDARRMLADSRDDLATAERQIGKVGVQGKATQSKRERAATVANREAEVAKTFQTTDTTIFSRIDVAEDSIDLELAQAKAGHAARVQGVERKVSARQRALHEIAREQHGREVEHAQERLARLEVTAPHDGVVVLERGWRGETVRVGDTVWGGQKLAELPLVAAMQADVFVLEADAGNVVEQLGAELVVDAHPERAFEAKVKHIDTLAQPRNPEVPVHYFGVELAVAEPDLAVMRVGQRVHATIFVEQADAIVVPRQAVFERDGRHVVFRRRGDEFLQVEVALGQASPGRVVLEAGLEPGDEVALRDPEQSNAAAAARGAAQEGSR